jgi:hypothetical protein
MPLSVSNSLYSYATGTIGSADIKATGKIQESATLADIHSAYKSLFETYGEMHDTLLKQLNKIFDEGYSGSLNLEGIFSDVFSKKYESECKEGIKAYKYYLKEVVMGLNNLLSWKEQADTWLGQLNGLTGSNQNENGGACYLITQLEIADKHVQDIIKTFTEYVVQKDVTQTSYVNYNDGTKDKTELLSREDFSVCETEYMDISKTYTSKLKEDIKDIEGLKELKVQKQTVTRELDIFYYKDSKKEELTDKYDNLAYYDVQKNSPDTITTKKDSIALFDELPLLDKLQYIKIYYNDSKGSRYIFPKDKNFGYPCIEPKDKNSPTEDNNEIGQLEMFYIGYLVDQDGPVNAIASFMEVKSAAIREQIVLMSYRVKALQYYIKLLNRGFEELTKSQSSGTNPIPDVSKHILQYFGPNITRSLMYLKNADGTFLKDGAGNELKNPYLVVQYNGNSPDESDQEGYHLTGSNTYILIEATDAGIESFVGWNSNKEENISYGDYGKEASEKLAKEGGFEFESYEEYLHKIFSPEKEVYGSVSGEIKCCSVKIKNANENFTVGDTINRTIIEEEGKQQMGTADEIDKMTDEDSTYTDIIFTTKTIKPSGSSGSIVINWRYKCQRKKSKFYVYIKVYDEEIIYNLTLPSSNLFLRFQNTNAAKKYLPKELEVSRLDLSKITVDNYAGSGYGWNSTSEQLKNVSQSTWTGFIESWTSTYDTTISNYKSQLEYVEKTIASLRKKIDTFDSMASSSRSKAYSIYNKTVNKIG